MPNRNGLDTRFDPRRQPVRPSYDIASTPYGFEAHHERSTFSPGMTRREAFEDVTKYTAGPFKTERRAAIAGQAMSERDEDQLGQYRSGSKSFAVGRDHDD